ncbi:Hemolysin secretion protein D, chromosomal [Sporomusa ovata DSM 2662]|uniref:HlyD family secretion protein n=1 Tax=Sporomusa ovata TaxID=2378 RepID=A0A0U1L3M4_9FIRM|nr:HlyD family type I secretion periplasmic adaptor subunit [Sporomusa ovata]EQB25705.1 leukotoxin secretion protein D [Sporomusa ovata DSM 2662]CQR74266.1 HlyD family secretion protein [Sporomusa ovata]
MRLKIGDWFQNKITGLKNLHKATEQSDQLTRTEMEFLPAALEVVETPPSPLGRAIAWMLISLFVIALLWACIGHVDEVAVAPGKIIPSGYTKTIQAFDTGVVKTIHVKNGSKVQPGDVLIELDTTFTAADLARQLKEQAYYQLEIARLLAEQQDIPFVPNSNAGVNPQDVQYQLQLYRSRMAEYQAKLAAAQQAVNQAGAALDTIQATKEKLTQQLEIITEQENKMKELADAGAVGSFQYLEYRKQRIGIQQDLAAQSSDLVKANHALLQSMETLNNIKGEHDKDIMQKLVDDRRQLQAVEEDLHKAQEKNRLSTVTSPIAGTVQQLAVTTVGGVVTPAQNLMLVVPEGEQLEVEAWVANKDIGFLYEGQNAEIKVETFNFQKYGTLDATLVEISRDAVEDKDKGLIYRALLRTNSDYFDLASGRTVSISPGMAVTAEIKTRQKQIIEYFMDPFIKYKSEGLRER